MPIKISYSNKSKKKAPSNLVLFVDENFNIKAIKNFFSNNEFLYVSDLLKNSDLKKNFLVFRISSRKIIYLVSIKKDLKSSDIENLIKKVRRKVFEKTGVNLELEIKIIGE